MTTSFSAQTRSRCTASPSEHAAICHAGVMQHMFSASQAKVGARQKCCTVCMCPIWDVYASHGRGTFWPSTSSVLLLDHE
eukprot:6554043-Prymnesium_polylepis.3